MGAATLWRRRTKATTSGETIARIAARLEPTARRAFLAAMERLGRDVHLDTLVQAIRERDARQIERLLGVPNLAEDLKPLITTLHRGYGLSGEAGATELAQQLAVLIAFDLTSPTAIHWARMSAAQLVTRISDTARATIREVVAQGLQHGIAPIEQARIIREVIPLTEAQANAVLTYRAELVAAGRDAEQVARMADRYARQLLNYRSQLVARTETIAASNQGLRESWAQAAQAGYLDREKTQRIWQAAPDACPEVCAPMEGQMVAFDGEPFTTGAGDLVNEPPAHPACRCSMGLVL